jgi:putative acetyltransferase
MITVRPETKKDYPAITQIIGTAFGQSNEGRLVENLRRNKKFIERLSPVAWPEHKMAGHILFSPITIRNQHREFESLALAPVAVFPDEQRRGIGSELIRQGLTVCRKEGFRSVIVLRYPDDYPRFGFRKASRWKIFAPFAYRMKPPWRLNRKQTRFATLRVSYSIGKSLTAFRQHIGVSLLFSERRSSYAEYQRGSYQLSV